VRRENQSRLSYHGAEKDIHSLFSFSTTGHVHLSVSPKRSLAVIKALYGEADLRCSLNIKNRRWNGLTEPNGSDRAPMAREWLGKGSSSQREIFAFFLQAQKRLLWRLSSVMARNAGAEKALLREADVKPV
jgi:hypothetical protein